MGLSERRKRPRARVRCQVQFLEDESRVLQCTTSDMSCGGFYVLSQRAFKPGERLQCILAISSSQSGKEDEMLMVHCKVEVVRVEDGDFENQFGIACKILDYRARAGMASAHR